MIEARRIFWVGSFAAFFVLLPSRACGQASTPPKICVDWGNVQNWTGTISISGGGSASDPNSGVQYITSESGVVNLTGITNRTGPCNASTAQYVWQAAPTQVTLSNVSIHDKFTSPETDSNGNPCTLTTSYDVDGGTGSATLSSGASIFLDLTVPSSPVYTASVSTYQDVAVTVTGCGASGTASPQSDYQWGPGNPPPSAYPGLPSTVGPVNPSVGFTAQGPLGGQTNSWTMSWNLKPIVPQVDVLVTTTSDYCTWRPTAGASETDINTVPLGILALLVQHGTNQVQNGVIPSDWTFKLTGISQEPGVALNWPVSGASSNDMAFNSTINVVGNPTVTISPDGTQAEFITPITLPNPALASAAVSTFDWGGWATLNVTATVSGQPQTTVKGYIQQCDGSIATDILLPMRQAGSFIADSWKTAHGIALDTSDADDSENNPNGNTDYAGDGLTLFEEYRGFYVHCAGCQNGLLHVEGDPKKKDLFVINLAGRPEVNSGIGLFKSSTGLNVCCKTLGKDQITSDRIINFNHLKGPHVTDQHVILIDSGKSGVLDACTSTTTLMPGTPKVVNKIYIPSILDYRKYANFLRKIGAIPTDPTSDVRASVAHELAHASSIWHHGDIDGADATVWWYTPNGTQIMEIGKGNSLQSAQRMQAAGFGNPISVFTENNIQLNPTNLGFGVSDLLPLYQGVTRGQHGGDVFCLMRYHFSLNYVAQSNSGWRYFTSEFPGSYITDISQGTGTNVARRTPQTRYGDSASNRGDCSKQLCVNDNLTPNPRGTASSVDCATEQQ
jgi:hypothetical protein